MFLRFFCPWPGHSVWLLFLLCPTAANECDSSLMKPVGKPSLSSCVGSKNNLLSKFPENGFGYLLCWYTYLYWLGTDMLFICSLSLSGFLPLSSVYPSNPLFFTDFVCVSLPLMLFPQQLTRALSLFVYINQSFSFGVSLPWCVVWETWSGESGLIHLASEENEKEIWQEMQIIAKLAA